MGENRWKGRGLWTLADQAASSITNFALTYIVLRSVSLADFGSFTVAYASYLLAVSVVRSLIGEPFMIRHGLDDDRDRRSAVKAATGAALGIGLLCGLAAGLMSFAFTGVLRASLLILAALLPLLLLQDVWRFAFFAVGRPWMAFYNDLSWGVVQLSLVGLALGAGSRNVALFVAIWGGSGAFAGVLGVFQSRVLPDMRGTLAFLLSHRDLGIRFLGEFVVDRGASQATLLMIGSISGLAALGALNGARVLLGPINVVYLGSVAFGVPEAIRLRTRSPDRFASAIRTSAVILAGSALMLGLALLALPMGFGKRIVPEGWEAVHGLLVPVTLLVAGEGSRRAYYVGLRALGSARSSLKAQMLVAPVVVIGGVVGAGLWGALGAAFGLAIAAWFAGFVWSRSFGREMLAVLVGDQPRLEGHA